VDTWPCNIGSDAALAGKNLAWRAVGLPVRWTSGDLPSIAADADGLRHIDFSSNKCMRWVHPFRIDLQTSVIIARMFFSIGNHPAF
jgi:hypothetical protein